MPFDLLCKYNERKEAFLTTCVLTDIVTRIYYQTWTAPIQIIANAALLHLIIRIILTGVMVLKHLCG